MHTDSVRTDSVRTDSAHCIHRQSNVICTAVATVVLACLVAVLPLIELFTRRYGISMTGKKTPVRNLVIFRETSVCTQRDSARYCVMYNVFACM